MKSNIPIDGNRLWSDLMAIAEITEDGIPYTRRSFSPLFIEGRRWLRQKFEEAGLEVRTDAAGNLIGRLPGSRPEAGTIMLGSHSDTVPSGGRFDGVAGVIAALEIVRSLRASGKPLQHSVEIVDFLAEEPSEYGLSCVGSRGMAGLLEDSMLRYKNGAGEQLGQAIERVGGDISRLAEAKRDDVIAFLELHIEQGLVLEAKRIDLGVVTAIVGIARVEICLEGRADHAGTTPMELRQDASVVAAHLITEIAAQAKTQAQKGDGHFVATTGIVEVSPNAANVVPGRVRLVVDIRAEKPGATQAFIDWLNLRSQSMADAANVKRPGWSVLSHTDPALCHAEMQAMLAGAAEMLGFSTLHLASGAGHDAAFISRIAPSAMLFVPCLDGRSHAPEEWAEPSAIAAGAAVIYETLLKIDGASALS
ncbi:MAG TPA: Zn-dependent hydrolase [Terriglobales bacterium]|nr:Zn-dependent hydrolase [Terriglobales bacterium]